MRPDQHKKKRSTQYKKKHGISDKPKNDDNNNNKNNKEKVASGQGSTQWQAPEKVNNTKDVTKTLTSKNENNTKEGESSAEEEDELAASFRRRKIVSNWDRYQSLPPEIEDENLSEIGADFGKLLSQTADALSQFRFKDEKEWEEDKTLLSSSFVALDCEALANSLQCLPLNERLGLDATLFSDEQIEDFAAEAEKSRMLYNPDSCSTIVQEQQTALDVKAIHSVLSAAMHLAPALLKTVKAKPTHVENGTEIVPVEEGKEKTGVPDKEDSKLIDVAQEPGSKSANMKKSPCVIPQVKSDPISEEDELHTLLSLGKTKPQADVGGSGNIDQPAEISSSGEKKYVSSATASLEDWLDSVLDS